MMANDSGQTAIGLIAGTGQFPFLVADGAKREGRRVIVVGFTGKDITINAGRMMFREVEMKGSLGCGLQDFPVLINLVKGGKLKVKELVTHRYPLEEINEGLAFLDKGDPSLIRSIVVP